MKAVAITLFVCLVAPFLGEAMKFRQFFSYIIDVIYGFGRKHAH